MTNNPNQLSGNLGEILSQLQQKLTSYPRRQPGELTLEGRPFRYVDLHSFYHQAVQIFAQGLYDFESSTPAPVVYDCGAHIGLASLFFKQRYPAARIVAFEADPAICDVLRFNLNSFGATDIEVRQQAVWTHDDGVTFQTSSDDAGMVAEQSGGSSATSVTVPSTSLQKLLRAQAAELVKLDIEGAEFSVIQDCAPVLRQARCYLVEVHIFQYPSKLGALLSAFEQNGFRYVLSDLHQTVWLPLDPQSPKPPFKQCSADKFLVSVFAWRV
jgi:FkbM family methyltransferase